MGQIAGRITAFLSALGFIFLAAVLFYFSLEVRAQLLFQRFEKDLREIEGTQLIVLNMQEPQNSELAKPELRGAQNLRSRDSITEFDGLKSSEDKAPGFKAQSWEASRLALERRFEGPQIFQLATEINAEKRANIYRRLLIACERQDLELVLDNWPQDFPEISDSAEEIENLTNQIAASEQEVQALETKLPKKINAHALVSDDFAALFGISASYAASGEKELLYYRSGVFQFLPQLEGIPDNIGDSKEALSQIVKLRGDFAVEDEAAFGAKLEHLRSASKLIIEEISAMEKEILEKAAAIEEFQREKIRRYLMLGRLIRNEAKRKLRPPSDSAAILAASLFANFALFLGDQK